VSIARRIANFSIRKNQIDILRLICQEGEIMNARDLERLLTDAGATATKTATITGQLRGTGHLPKAGRGPYAPSVGAREAAVILTAVAGCSRANEAGERMRRLERLTASDGELFIDRLTALLDDAARVRAVVEVRVARTIGRALIIYRDGRVEEFLGRRQHDLEQRFRAVGELPGGLLETVAVALKQMPPVRAPRLPSDDE
jgi:hypothetical protein